MAPRTNGNTAVAATQVGATDPFRNFNFLLDINGVSQGHFTECSGMTVKVEAIQYREGGNGQIVRQIPGQVQYGPVTLRYGLTSSTELWEWLMTAVQGRVVRKNVSIIMVDADGSTTAMHWILENAWPSEWRGAPLNALGHEMAIESLTLHYETLRRENG
jgi:phage tail-like protein